MDDNQDGLNGMPLEPWMSQQHLSSVHPSLSSQVYNPPMSAQSIHDFMSHRALQSFSAVEPIHSSPQLVTPSALQQYSLSSSSRLHQPEHVSTSHERSAWSHLLSLDPSVAAMGSHMSEPQESLRHYLPQDMPHVQNTRQEQLLMLKGNTKLTTSFDNISLPKMQFSLASGSTASIPVDSYSQMPTVNSSQNNLSQFTQLMNVSKKGRNTIKPPTPKTLAISNDVSSLESSGSYSPVSPPATDVDQPSISNSVQNIGRVAELFLRETSHEMPSATFPLLSSPDQADIFNYLSEKTDPFSSDLSLQDSISEQAKPLTESSFLPNTSDVPLDMTTAFSSKAGKGIVSKEPSQIDTEVAFPSESISSDKSSLIQSLLTKDQAYHRDFFNEMNAATSLSERNQPQYMHTTADDKISKPIKSTPKKSNFYGRDASLFSFVPSSSFSNEPQVPAQHFSESVETDVTENKNSAVDLYTEVATVLELDKTNNTAGQSPIITDEIKLIADVQTSSSNAECPAETLASVSTSSANLPVLESITSQSESNDTLTEVSEAKETVFNQNEDTLEAENYDSTNGNYKCVLNSNGNIMISGTLNMEKEHSDENVNHWNDSFDVSSQIGEDFLSTEITSKTKSKRKKRKASGIQAKQRKKPVRKQLQVSQLGAFDDNCISMENSDYSLNIDAPSAEASESQYYENACTPNESVPAKRKTRQLAKAKAPSIDLTPRRSSSRKSKDNAMRLIELQADSNYSGVSQPVEVVEKKATRKRKKSKSSLSLATSDDLSDFSDDTIEEDKNDDHDGDYVFDEDEIETLENDEIFKTGKKVIKERKLGGLKISIKLSGNSSAEIVSGIQDSSPRKKRKTVKKKNIKTKGKNKVKIYKQPDDTDIAEEVEDINATGENLVQDSTSSAVSDKVEDTGNSTDVKDRHLSLMEKYFSTANSATVARQSQKKTVSGNEAKGKKKNTDGSKSKIVKNLTLKSGRKQTEQGDGGKQKASVKFVLESGAKKDKTDKGITQDDADTEVPKFVCGYCPQRYHNKQELLAHMEAHMVEMERRTDVEATPVTDENIKEHAVKSNRTGPSATFENINEKVKLKSTIDQDKDSDVKHVQGTMKQKFKCGECGQVFDSKPSLLDHVRIHTAEKPFECDICHKCFTERNFLSAHRKTHDQEKLLRCHVCSKAFVDKTDLNLHMQSHPRRSNNKSTGMLSIKKSFKKGVHEKHEEEVSVPSKKPKSFASALTGEIDTSGKTNDTPPVLILTRRDAPSTEVKNNASKTVLIEPLVSLKPITSTLHKPSVIVKTNSYSKKPAESPAVSSSVKGDNSKMDSKNSKDVESSSEGKTQETTSAVCTCKECPDCVTRFLQSFE